MSSEYNPTEEDGMGSKFQYAELNDEEPTPSGSKHQYTELSSAEHSGENSADQTRPGTPSGLPGRLKERGRVRFNSNSEVNDSTNKRSSFPLQPDGPVSLSQFVPPRIGMSPAHSRNSSAATLIRRTPEFEKADPFSDAAAVLLSPAPVRRPRPSVLRNNSATSVTGLGIAEEEEGHTHEKAFSALAAQERAQRIASLVGSHSAPATRRNSLEEDFDDGYVHPRNLDGMSPIRLDDIPLADMSTRRYDAVGYESEEEFSEKERHASSTSEAHQLVRAHTQKMKSSGLRVAAPMTPGLVSGQVTPTEDQDVDYVARPDHYRGGVLSSLLKLYNQPGPSHHRRGSSAGSVGSASQFITPGSSGTTTPMKAKNAKWYNHKNQSKDTLAGLIEASAILGAQGGATHGARPKRPGPAPRSHSARLLETVNRMSRPPLEDEIRITVHIAETLSRQKYLIRLCRALMSYGAPTHRLEEYMKMTARVLEIDGQFLYIPGCMICSFDDASTHTTEVKLVRSVQGVDLGKLKDVHEIYKEVVHDVIGVEEATQRLEIIIKAEPKNNKWFLVLVYGLASASVGPFAFEARLIDLPIAFILGSLLGILQLIVAPKSDLYSNVFEISAAVLTSFLARAFGSIPYNGNPLFCFSALAQSAIALILPGYMVLCGSLELQSRSMVAGSVRMVYAIIYSLFLGFGITIGTAIYGLLDENATSATTCQNPINPYYRFFFVPCFTMCLAIINQAKWKQTPVMLLIAFAGYIVNFFSARKFPSNAQISNTLGALAVGVLGNLYSRLRHGVAAAALLPAIFVQVPSGLAASGSLLAGLTSADQITNSTTYPNGTSRIPGGTSSVTVSNTADLNSIVFNVGYSMIQVAIGITVGLFLSALIVYPLGKRRSGLFSF